MKQQILIVLFALLAGQVKSQSVYIGLADESNMIAGAAGALNLNFWPDFQIIENALYVPTINGIYTKELSTLSNTDWQLFAFEGVPIKDFVKDGDQIIAITNNINSELLLYSDDNGETYTFRPDAHFTDPDLVPAELSNQIHQIAHHSPSFDSLLVVHHFGISLSTDAGFTWTLLEEYVPEYQYRFADFHPQNPSKMYSTGETGFFASYVLASEDGGLNWSEIHSDFNDCVHLVSFHPTEEDTYLIGREGKISKSTDSGNTWTTFNLDPYLYVYQFRYDPNDPNVIYASGGLNGLFDTIYFIRSTDGGDTWSFIYEEVVDGGGTGQILDFYLLDDQIIYLTALKGLYSLQLNALSTENLTTAEADLTLYPNPTSSLLKVNSSQPIEQYSIFDSTGRLLRSAQPQDLKADIDLTAFDKGVYHIHLISANERFIRKVIKH